MGSQALPSFFVIGPPRTGTSWLHQVLKTRAALPDVKETRFFDLHFGRGLDWYIRHFPRSEESGLPIGEVAPTYFASSEARQRIAWTLPGAKVACIFRNPVERIVSLYRVRRAHGMIPWSFEEALFKDKELLESSKYATHLLGWQQSLGRDQVLATLYDDLLGSPQAYIDVLCEFLGIQRFTVPCTAMSRVHTSESLAQPRWHTVTHTSSLIAEWLKTKRLNRVVAGIRESRIGRLLLASGMPFEHLSPDISQTVYGLIADEIDRLQGLLGCDLSHWRPSSSRVGHAYVIA
jgi:Sulfotransferase domain